MSRHSDQPGEESDWERQRMKIIGLGESSMRKSYYPELQQYIRELEDKNRELEAAYAEQTAVSEELRQQMEETAQKEQELRRSEERFRNLIDASPVPILLARDGRFVYVNRAFCRMTGFADAGEVVGKELLGFIAPEYREQVAGYIRARTRGEPAAVHYEAAGLRRDGSRFPYEITVAVILLSDGPVTMAFVSDISERKAAEEAVARSDARLRRAEVIAGIGHWEFRMETGIALASEGARKIYGISGNEWKIEEIQKIPLPEYRDMLDNAIRGLIAGERPYDVGFRIRRPTDNAILDIRSLAEYDPRSRTVFGVIQDVTAQKRAEAEIRESEKKHRDLVEASPDCIWEVDTAGRFTYLSPKMADILGYEPEELLGKTFFDLLSPDQAAYARELFGRSMQEYRGLITIEIIALHADGHPVDLEIRSAGATDDRGGITGFRGISRDITVRKRAEAALRENEAFLTSIFENIPLMLFVKDARDLRFVRFNRAGEDLLGYSRSEMIGKNDRDFFPKEQAEFFSGKDREVLDGKLPVDIPEETIGTRCLGDRILHTRKIPILSECGEPRYLLGIAEDITEQRTAAARLRDSEEMFRSLVRESADGISLIDEEGRVIEWNNAIAVITGISRGEAIGALQSDLLVTLMVPEHRTPERIERFRSAIGEAQKTGESPWFSRIIEARILRRDGEQRVIHQLVFPIPTMKGYRIGSMVRDVTDLKSAEESLRRSEERYRTLVEVTNTGYLVLDDRGLVVDANDAYVRLTGRASIGDLLGRPVTDWTAPYDLERNAREVSNCLKTGSVQGLEVDYLRPDRTIQPVEVNAALFHGERGDVILTLCRDIAERRKLNLTVQQARKKLNLLNTVTFQDIQSAVFSLAAYHILIKQLKPDSRILSFMDKETVLIQKITTSLEFARNYQDMGMQPPRWQNVNQTFLFAISHLDFLSVSHTVETGGLELFADPLLEKVFFNLMENVLRHGPGTTSVRIWYREEGSGLVLFIEDNGPGVPQEEKHMIFDRGYGKDTGLGLFLVREILSITGMSIRETGMAGKGARFEILVPKEGYRFGRC